MLFHTHSNIIRSNISETVLADSKASKEALYITSSNIIGFKVDMRFVFDFEEEEFDLGCAKACMSLFSGTKLEQGYGQIV